MRIKRKWLKHMCSIIFTLYYLICAEQADEKVRAVRSIITVEHLRNSWNKTQDNPILRLTSRLLRPRTMRYKPREIRIPRPEGSSYTDSVHGWLYYDGPISALKRHTKLVLDIPGGGFVAMSPRTHDDALMAWAAKTGIPILSLDYGKAPEHPYPYALHECFDVYRTIVQSRGRCVGLFSDAVPQVIFSGDSAGGSLAAGLTIMVIEASLSRKSSARLPPPAGLVLIYPCLDVNIGNWMTDEQMALIRDKDSRQTNQRVLRRKTSIFMRTAATPYASEDESSSASDDGPLNIVQASLDPSLNNPRPTFKTRVAVPSMISYFSDRLLNPEMMRAMIILYVGPHRKPNFATDYYLSPVLAPDYILSRFPKTYFMTGERDPLVDDTCIMAGRLRQAKRNAARRENFDTEAEVKINLIKGISHGFLQMAALYPKARDFIDTIGGWYDELFSEADKREREKSRLQAIARRSHLVNPQLDTRIFQKQHGDGKGDISATESVIERRRYNNKRRESAGATSDESDAPLEMSLKPLTTTHTNGNSRPKPSRMDSLTYPTSSTTRRRVSEERYVERKRSGSLKRKDSSMKIHKMTAAAKSPTQSHRSMMNGKVRSPASERSVLSSEDEDVESGFEPTSPLVKEHPIRRGGTWDKHMSRVSLQSALLDATPLDSD